ncbi:MAG: flavin monoamine oxidase family protein [Acidobacteria bacterium]|nr:flavin monoamine oxidase family protein [Acidobacteriota bacterium]
MKNPINRREFLKHAALAALFPSSVSVSGAQKHHRPSTRKRIVIIGAGLAGLSAAYELTQAGHDVMVLEARTRAGGRVYTLREPFSDGLYAEAGAAHIPDIHYQTIRYARLFGLTLVPFSPYGQSDTSYLRGKRIKVPAGRHIELSSLPLSLKPEERKGGVPGLWERYVTPVLTEIGRPKTKGWLSESLRKFDRLTFAELLRECGASSDAIALLEMPYYKPEDDQISALWWLREAALLKDQKLDYKIKGGNDLLPKAFAKRLATKIHYGAEVVRIEHDRQSVTITYHQAGTTRQLSTDYLVCATPFTTLRRIEISPPFSSDKQQAINHHAYDSVTRVFLQTNQRSWEKEGVSGFARTDLPEEIWHPTFDQTGKRGILVSYRSGVQARQLSALSEKDRISAVSNQLEQVFPGLSETLESGVSYCWDEDQWACGAYSILKPGEMFSLFPHIARPEGRVYFAGEHTSMWPGWMQGALDSGNRVTQEIILAP